MKTIDSHATCRVCGARLPTGPLSGLCPACLFDSSLQGPTSDTAPGQDELPITANQPRRFGRYQVFEEISRGGAGVVFRARDEALHREVALKFLRAGPLASRDDTRRLFLEARAAARLNHPGIVPVFEIGGADDAQPFLAMAFLPGGTLAQRLKQSPMTPVQAARWLAIMARAVHFAHQHGILHRDLKPGNILFDAAGSPLVADFGLARLLDEDQTLTRTDAVLGTPAYLAPEQAGGHVGEITTAADIHALGAILYEMLTGRPPFTDSNLPSLLRQIAETSPIAPRQINPGIPRDLETICL
ncbi:MAG: serine/threonine protein kinase, partial [Verrucomicrobia bacterium]